MSFSVCHGSCEDACNAVCAWLGVCFTRSINCPNELKVPTEISLIAYPTQFRTSSLPCVSHVLELSVIQMRRNLVWSGLAESLCTWPPPIPAFTSPCGKFTQAPEVCLFSASSFPVQY